MGAVTRGIEEPVVAPPGEGRLVCFQALNVPAMDGKTRVMSPGAEVVAR